MHGWEHALAYMSKQEECVESEELVLPIMHRVECILLNDFHESERNNCAFSIMCLQYIFHMQSHSKVIGTVVQLWHTA